MHMRHAIRVPQTTSKHTRTPSDVTRSRPKPVITNGERFVTFMHSCLTYVMLCISGKYLVQQMQLEVNMQPRAVLGGHCMTIGRVWVGLLCLIHLHVHSAITPHIPCNAAPEHPTSERASVFGTALRCNSVCVPKRGLYGDYISCFTLIIAQQAQISRWGQFSAYGVML